VILGWFLWLVIRACGVRHRHGAWAVALFLFTYALMTGARPSAMRAAVKV
jgi:competence protein ComEC